jgi:anti-sigma factor RsiW
MNRASGADPKGQKGMGTAPTDLELMLWADGELPPERAAEVALFIAHDSRARAVLATMRLAGDLLEEHSLAVAHAAGADAIAENVTEIVELEASRRLISEKPLKVKRFTWRASAATAVGLAFAAAAAWFVFFRVVGVSRLASTPVVATLSTAAAAIDSSDVTALIEVVDFGSRPGTIFYVPSEGESVAVVWLTDDDSSPDSSPASGEEP